MLKKQLKIETQVYENLEKNEIFVQIVSTWKTKANTKWGSTKSPEGVSDRHASSVVNVPLKPFYLHKWVRFGGTDQVRRKTRFVRLWNENAMLWPRFRGLLQTIKMVDSREEE